MKLAHDHGPVLTGRATAAALVEDVLARVAEGDQVVLDFSDVRAVSPSFADELFGKLETRVDVDRVEFINMSEHLQAVARMARDNRRAADAAR